MVAWGVHTGGLIIVWAIGWDTGIGLPWSLFFCSKFYNTEISSIRNTVLGYKSFFF